MVASHSPPTGDLACNPGMCLDWEWNRQLFALQSDTQSTELHQPGLRHIIIKRPKVKDKERLLKAREKKLVPGRLPDGKGEGENR